MTPRGPALGLSRLPDCVHALACFCSPPPQTQQPPPPSPERSQTLRSFCPRASSLLLSLGVTARPSRAPDIQLPFSTPASGIFHIMTPVRSLTPLSPHRSQLPFAPANVTGVHLWFQTLVWLLLWSGGCPRPGVLACPALSPGHCRAGSDMDEVLHTREERAIKPGLAWDTARPLVASECGRVVTLAGGL